MSLMGDFLKAQKKWVLVLPLVGVALVGGLLLAQQRSEAGRDGSGEEGSWKLTVYYKKTMKHTANETGSSSSEEKYWILDGTAIIEAPVINMKDKDPEIYLHYMADEDPTRVKVKLTSSASDRGTESKGNLVSFTGQASISYQSESRRDCCCPPGGYSSSGSHQGSSALKAGEGSFSIHIQRGQIERGKLNVTMNSGLFDVTEQKIWKDTCNKTSGTLSPGPYKNSVGTHEWPISRSDCTGQVSRTPRGYTGKVQCYKHMVPDELHFPKIESEITENISFALEMEERVTVEAVMIPEEGYEEWIPRAGEKGDLPEPQPGPGNISRLWLSVAEAASGDTDALMMSPEDRPGNKINVKVALQKKGKPGQKPNQTAMFTFELLKTSQEPGICMNWPPKAKAKNTFDLKIAGEENKELTILDKDGQSAESKKGLKESEVTITSYDYGSYGKLKVTAILDDGKKVVAYWEKKPEQAELTIPLDENDNHIADEWEEQNLGRKQSANPKADEENDPKGDPKCYDGDGFSLYEEYRGFMIKGKHERTSPITKDLFIYTEVPAAVVGIDFFEQQSGLRMRRIKSDEMDKERVVNFNYSEETHVVDQHGLIMREHELDEDLGGKAMIGPPKFVYYVYIKKGYLVEHPGNIEQYKVIIAHELGHAVGMIHHGEGDYKRVFHKGELEGLDKDEELKVAVQGGEHSGVDNCIMRYVNGRVVETPDGKFKWYNGSTRTEIFCKEKGSNPETGKATRGNCMKQICISDRAYMD